MRESEADPFFLDFEDSVAAVYKSFGNKHESVNGMVATKEHMPSFVSEMMLIFGAGFGYSFMHFDEESGRMEFVKNIITDPVTGMGERFPRYHLIADTQGQDLRWFDFHWDIDDHMSGGYEPEGELQRLIDRSDEDDLFKNKRLGRDVAVILAIKWFNRPPTRNKATFLNNQLGAVANSELICPEV